jgi:hypothetical protein
MATKMIQDAVLRKLQIMVQSSMRLSTAFREEHPEIEWEKCEAFVILSCMTTLKLIWMLSGILLNMSFLRLRKPFKVQSNLMSRRTHFNSQIVKNLVSGCAISATAEC